MSRESTLSILGLYGYDNTLFDLLQLPEGLNKETLVNTICYQLAELEILYPNPDVMKNLIGLWSNTCQYEWAKLYATMQLQYNPIDNYDRTETRALNSQGSGTSQGTGSSQDGGTETNSGSTQNNETGSNTNKIAGFNASPSLVDRTKDDNSVNSAGTVQNTTTFGKTNSNTFNNTESFTKADTETIRAHGNIGVTTTQQMMEQEREISKFNIYDIITEEFKQRFCILVY